MKTVSERLVESPWADDEVCQAWLDADGDICTRERDGSTEALLASFARRRQAMPEGVKEYIGRWAEMIVGELYDSGAMVDPYNKGRGYPGVIVINSSGVEYR